jgi:hypothetical protein
VYTRAYSVTKFRKLLGPVGEVVEQGHAIRLRPDAYFARLLELLVVPVNGFLTIERDREVAALKVHAERVPILFILSRSSSGNPNVHHSQ